MPSDDGYALARALLLDLDLPMGTANAFYRDRDGGQLVVWLDRPARIPPNRRPKSFRGVKVVFEKRPRLQPFAS